MSIRVRTQSIINNVCRLNKAGSQTFDQTGRLFSCKPTCPWGTSGSSGFPESTINEMQILKKAAEDLFCYKRFELYTSSLHLHFHTFFYSSYETGLPLMPLDKSQSETRDVEHLACKQARKSHTCNRNDTFLVLLVNNASVTLSNLKPSTVLWKRKTPKFTHANSIIAYIYICINI